MLVALSCAPTSGVEYARLYADIVEQVVARLLDDLERDFLGGRRRGDAPPRLPAEEADDALRQLCANIGPPEQERGADERFERLASLLVRADLVLEGLAREHGYDARYILPR